MLIPEDQYPDEAVVNVVIIGGIITTECFCLSIVMMMLLMIMTGTMIRIVIVIIIMMIKMLLMLIDDNDKDNTDFFEFYHTTYDNEDSVSYVADV